MKKALSISLASMVFSLEEDAYEKLDTYLKQIDKHFASNPDREEIINDIELSIAEKFSSRLTHGRKAVKLTDVNAVITDLGTIQQITQSDKDNETTDTSDGQQKKLYRDYDAKVLTGVCAGLAAYFGISVVWIRIIALALLFTPAAPFVLLTYFVLSISLSYAKTPAERMQMAGESLTLQSIEHSVKTRFEDGKNISVITSLLRKLPRIFPWLLNSLSLLVTVSCSLFLVGFTMAVGLLIFVPNSPEIAKPFPNFPTSSTEIAVVVLAYLCVVIPMLYIIILAVSLLKRRYILDTVSSIAFVVVWIACLVSTIVIAVRVAPGIERRMESIQPIRKTYAATDFSQVDIRGQYKVRLVEGSEYTVTISGEPKTLERIHVETMDNQLTISDDEAPRVCIFCSIHEPEIVIVAPDIEKVRLSGSISTDLEGFTHQDTLGILLQGSAHITLSDVALDRLSLEMEGVSQASATGHVENLSVTANGMTQLEASQLETNIAQIQAAGVAQLELWVHEKLEADLAGAANVDYRGNPKVSSHTNGSSNLDKME